MANHSINVHPTHILLEGSFWTMMMVGHIRNDGSEQFVFFLVVLCREFVRHSDRKCPLYKVEKWEKRGSHLNISSFFMIFSTLFFIFCKIHYMGWTVMNSVRDFHQYQNSRDVPFRFLASDIYACEFLIFTFSIISIYSFALL